MLSAFGWPPRGGGGVYGARPGNKTFISHSSLIVEQSRLKIRLPTSILHSWMIDVAYLEFLLLGLISC